MKSKKEQLIEFILTTDIPTKGIISTEYSWLDLAKLFDIKPNKHDIARRKAANDIWRNYKKKNPIIFRYITEEKGNEAPVVEDQSFQISLDRNWFQEETNKKEDGVYIILGCMHVPFVNYEFLRAVLKLISTLNVKGLILNGDYLDLNTLSFHDRGKLPIPGVTLGEEYKQGNAVLDVLEAAIGKDVYKAFIYGNHEDRFWRNMSQSDFSKLKGGIQSPTDALRLKERGYEVFENWSQDEVQLGDLHIIHGEFCNVHSCKAHLDTYKKNMLFAHTHRVQMYREGEHVAYNIGSMADFSTSAFNYATKSMKKKWANGFAIATLVEGQTSVEQIIWNKNHFTYGGIVYKA